MDHPPGPGGPGGPGPAPAAPHRDTATVATVAGMTPPEEHGPPVTAPLGRLRSRVRGRDALLTELRRPLTRGA